MIMNILSENLFDWFLSATLRGTLLAAAVLLIQFALRGRLPAFWRHALWLPVLFMLASPVLPETAWSLESVLASPPAQVTVVAPSAPEVTGLAEMPIATGPVVAAFPTIAAAASPPLDTRVIAARVWLGGVILVLGIGLYGHARILRRLRRGSVSVDPAIKAELAGAVETVGLRRAPRLLVSASVASPAMTGVFRPLLLLPANFAEGYDHQERRLILLHELIHLRRGDLLINGLLFLLQALHWCNPLLWFAFARFRADREAACDSAVLATSAEDARQSYGHALLKLSGAPPSAAWSLGFVGAFGRGADLRSRVQAIATYRRAHPAWTLVAIVLIGALTVAGGTRAEAEAEAELTGASEVGQQIDWIEISSRFFEVRAVDLPGGVERVDLGGGLSTAVLDEDAARAYFLRLSKQPGAEVLSAPRALTRAGQKAVIEVGEEIELVPGQPANFVGVQLGVVPDVGEEGGIELAVDFLYAEMVNGKAGKARVETRLKAEVAVKPGQTALLIRAGDGADGRQRVIALDALPAEKQRSSLAQTLKAVVLANVNFRDAALEEVIDFLRVRSRELDPEGQGVNFILTRAAMETSREKKLTFQLSSVPLSDVLRYVADLAELNLRVEEQAVVLDVAQKESPEPAEKPGIGEGSTLNAKLESIVLPKLDLRDASLEETIGFLRVRLRELDPDKQGVNFVITSAAMEAAREKKITLQLSNVPFSEVLRYVAELSGLQVRTDQHAVVLEVRQ
jgi:beta-lactamase regulating signal transducer with metallopeptidase domain